MDEVILKDEVIVRDVATPFFIIYLFISLTHLCHTSFVTSKALAHIT